MVKSYNETDAIKVFENLGNGCYQMKWAVTPVVEKDKETGEEKETTLSSYMMERYNYKPSMDLVLSDILSSGEQASMAEIKAICEGLEVEPLEYMRKALLEYITAYDASDKVNSFVLNEAPVWLDKATRVGLMNSTTIEKNSGNENTTLWLGSIKLEVNCDTAVQLLSSLELYALSCFNTTAAHKKAVQELATADELLAYDYTTGYPEKLTMTV